MPVVFGSFTPPAGTVQRDWGELRVEQPAYRPLETVRLRVGPAATGAHRWRVQWHDGLGQAYGAAEGTCGDGPCEVTFTAGGAPGMQFVRLWLDGAARHCRLVNFDLQVATSLRCGDPALDRLYPTARAAMLLNRRRYALDGGMVVGYTTADSVQTLAFWLRDMFYNLPGYRLWERDVASGFSALLRRQQPDGSLPDGVRADGSTWRMITESDVEYVAVLAVYETWQITGDDTWLRAWLPAAERALAHLRGNPRRWHLGQGLVVRPHTCDTWDFSIFTGDVYDDSTPQVAALCDQTGYYAALLALAQMHGHLGGTQRALELGDEARNFRARAVDALWDGQKFQHHRHLSPLDHGSFDEAAQLAMSNPWAVTRGLATAEQGRRVVEQYRRRSQDLAQPPWWSLQPGYPHADYPFLARHPYQHTGGYCNGGLLPWVGGALAAAALACGEEPYGHQVLRDCAAFLQERDGELYTWYWPNGEPGYRTANTTGHDGWALGHWLDALFGGLAGLQPTAPAQRRVTVAPRWAATATTAATVVLHYPASEAYTAYRWEYAAERIHLTLTGVAERYSLRLLLPAAWRSATLDDHASQVETVGLSRYLTADLTGGGVRKLCARRA
ncbi:MAG: hypothetical protein IT204_17730 [Fimbriimonadaceae bacterium]|nr:hypothetical protein [Fimbriimonadaceae bacterium]